MPHVYISIIVWKVNNASVGVQQRLEKQKPIVISFVELYKISVT